MNTQVPIMDVILVLVVVGLALTPWPWLALLGGGGYYALVALINDRRTPPTDKEPKP